MNHFGTTKSCCPSEDTLTALAAGQSDGSAAEMTRRHLDGCRDCQTAVALLLASQPRRSTTHIRPVGSRIGGRFVVRGTLGIGAFSVVYDGWDELLERSVALKTIRAQDTETARERLLAESRALARLRHDNVVLVHDVVAENGELLLAIERVEGRNLRDWAAEETSGTERLLGVLADAAKGLAAAHSVGVIHRDFKPENVMVCADDRAVVIDLGLAFAQGLEDTTTCGLDLDVSKARLTLTGALVGTPAYMALEQLRGAAADVRSDVFAFATTAYELLSGQRPHQASTIEALTEARLRPTKSLPPTIPRRLRRCIAAGLSANPDARPASMGAFVRAFEARGPKRGRWAVGLTLTAVVGGAGIWHARNAAPACEARAPLPTWIAVNGLIARDDDPAWAGAIEEHNRVLERGWSDTCGLHGSALAAQQGCLNDIAARRDAIFAEVNAGDLEPGLAAESLPSPLRCTPSYLGPSVVPPNAEDATEVAKLRQDILDAWSQLVDGDPARAESTFEDLTARAREIGYEPALAESLLWHGTAWVELSRFGDARAAFLEATRLALSSRSGYVSARAWLGLMELELHDGAADFEQADAYAAMTRGALAGLGDHPERRKLEMVLEYRLAHREIRAGNQEAALAHYDAALQRIEAGSRRDELLIREGRANALSGVERHDEAVLELRALLTSKAANRTDRARVQYNLGVTLTAASRYEEAESAFDAGVAVLAGIEDVTGLRPLLLNARLVAGCSAGRPRAQLEALADRVEYALDPDLPAHLRVRAAVGVVRAEIALDAGDAAAAADLARAVLPVVDSVKPPAPMQAELRAILGRAAFDLGDEQTLRAMAAWLDGLPPERVQTWAGQRGGWGDVEEVLGLVAALDGRVADASAHQDRVFSERSDESAAENKASAVIRRRFARAASGALVMRSG